MAIICHLQPANIHAVDLHVRLAVEGYLLLRWYVEVLDFQVSHALDVELDDLGFTPVILVDGTDPSAHHELHGVTVPDKAGGVSRDALDGGLKLGE